MLVPRAAVPSPPIIGGALLLLVSAVFYRLSTCSRSVFQAALGTPSARAMHSTLALAQF